MNFTFFYALHHYSIETRNIVCIYWDKALLFKLVEASSLAKDCDQSPFLLTVTLDAISYNSIIPVHCHLLGFVCYTPYNDIIFLTLKYRIYWNSTYRCCWNVPTNEWAVNSWKVKVIILCHIWVYIFSVSLREHLSSLLFGFFLWGPCCSYFDFFVFSYCVSLRSGFRVVLHVAISGLKRCSIRLYLRLFVGGLLSNLRYLCLFTYSGIQHILCSVFVLFFFILCALCCQFLWIVHLWLPLRCSLTLILFLLFTLIPPKHTIFTWYAD